MFRKRTKCKLFFDHKKLKLDVKGLTATIESNHLSNFNLQLGELKITPTATEISDELMRLDLLQCTLCQSIDKLSDSSKKDELLEKIVTVKIEMLQKALDFKKKRIKKVK